MVNLNCANRIVESQVNSGRSRRRDITPAPIRDVPPTFKRSLRDRNRESFRFRARGAKPNDNSTLSHPGLKLSLRDVRRRKMNDVGYSRNDKHSGRTLANNLFKLSLVDKLHWCL